MSSELKQFRDREPRPELARKLTVGVWVVTVLVLALVGLMRRVTIPLPDGVDLGMLPAFHALLNTLAALALVAALGAIKAGRPLLHQRFIYAAMILSGLFLLSYVCYHFTSGETLFGDADHDGMLSEAELAAAGGRRTFYLILLASHITLAALSLPFILLTFVYGWTAQFAKHRRLARWVFPVWLYVAVTGPVCYFLLRPYYG